MAALMFRWLVVWQLPAGDRQLQVRDAGMHGVDMMAMQIIEVIREHRFYEKKFVVETRPAGERELTDRQNVCPSTNPCPYLDPRPWACISSVVLRCYVNMTIVGADLLCRQACMPGASRAFLGMDDSSIVCNLRAF